MVSFKKDRNGLQLRLHTMFLAVGDEVFVALCGFIRGERKCGKRLDRFIAEQSHLVQQPLPRLRTRGAVLDLAQLFAEVNRTYFHGACAAHITWGRARRPRRSSIQLGLYTPALALITINPVLDQSFVPTFYVCFIIFHEMLHELLGTGECAGGRRQLHSREFRLLESSYPRYAECMKWEKDNLTKLLSSPLRHQGVRKAPSQLLTSLP
ncbi:MAG: hypothetical protein EOO40_02040 [Deltaproteobacteria bacterium]|nr:MAG: hypothetical protein EOO40_02040 [Deltaproteobacteria bacterium]